ncbi:hypothetical protein BO70DRAFT_320500 [Aspergillus heteromorphus CBS 117.55]|uniref:Rhodopsin domain-containing protein n=1 Tax=Aspergillus heteromorphus CBS 117.55 TaxID=1448321 RepID=A0A317VGL0_9EURO|nr:uncharacterized protein BO70DRAFT_320500 [Aspergillus heteromorphus CBS 117.55]PWY72291.1 hypothetical protein BO70DRAFT_320500 [Aspergillus heteromorphus CBS 117.55]
MGWVYNLHTTDPHSHVARVVGLCLAFSILACVAVALRFYVRVHTKRRIWCDDFASLLSAMLGMAYAGVSVEQTRWGLGLSEEYFPDANIVMFGKIQYAGGPLYTLALLGFKVSLLCSYIRIGGFVKAYRLTIFVAIVACVLNQLAFTFVLTFACWPVAKQWDNSIPGVCMNTIASYYVTGLGFDIIIIALPLPVLWKLQLRLRQKIALVGVFALGFFITIIQIIRICTIRNLRTWTDSEPVVIWSDVEISLGVMITCIPTYGPLIHAMATTLSSPANTTTTTTTTTNTSSPPTRTPTPTPPKAQNPNPLSAPTGTAKLHPPASPLPLRSNMPRYRLLGV